MSEVSARIAASMRPAPYPDDSGVRLRWLDFPCEAPGRTLRPMEAKRRDGTIVNIWRTLGMRPPDGEQDNRDWRPIG